ncbi:hypothetical protein ACQEPV_011930 [Xanthomonas oryzae pv. oryzicola]|uniref:hypothetical protein n=1 Tax=Xanthomonas oryzae TaxID=347 RepID=UPI0015C6938D|nr:hypothetical protein [Xanthomonas oryzae]
MSGPYVYEKATGEDFYVVGYYDPSGKFRTESDCDTREEAVRRVSFLNGGRLLDSDL